MRKILLLSAAIFIIGTETANAGGFHLNIFSPAPIYRPAPVYVVKHRPVYVETYPEYYTSTYPQYNYDHNYWYYEDSHRNHRRDCRRKKHHRHERHEYENHYGRY